jgi:rhodanese-related sulfurtransferase
VPLALSLMLGLGIGLPGAVFDVALAQDGQTSGQASAGFATIDSAQLAAMLQSRDFLLVNVHIPYEGEIEGTDALIAFDKIAENLDKLPSDKDAEIVLYCRSGRMSEIAAAELVRLGYTNVAHLSGGMIGWKERGHELVER